jgi:hypothetical protein
MSGAIPLLSLYAFMASIGQMSLFFSYISITFTAFRKLKSDFLKHDSTSQTLRDTGMQILKCREHQISKFFIQKLLDDVLNENTVIFNLMCV